MNEIMCFLNSHSEIKTVVYYIDAYYGISFLKNFNEYTVVSKIIIVCNTFTIYTKVQKAFKESISNKERYLFDVQIVMAENFAITENNWAFCAEQLSDKMSLSLLDLHPSYILINLESKDLNAYTIWEYCRNFSPYIQIKTIRYNAEPQMMIWDGHKEDIELSVIFPVYNVEKYLFQCLESITKWKAIYVEYIFVNDGSTDKSRDIILKYAQNDSRIKIIDKQNGGCASARQLGLEKAKGRYIGFVDPDDFIDESMFKKLLRAALIGSYDISFCGYNEYYEDTQNMRQAEDTILWPYCLGTADKNIINELIFYCRVAIWRGIYKASFLRENSIHFYTKLRRFDDLPFKVETFAYAKSIISIPEYLYYYRLSRPGQDVSANDERLYVHFDIFNYLNESICKTKNQRLIDCLQLCKIQTHLYALNKILPVYFDDYLRRAQGDLNSTGDFERTLRLVSRYLDENIAEIYKSLMLGQKERLLKLLKMKK